MRKCKCRDIQLLERKLSAAQMPDEFKQITIQSFDITLYEQEESKQRAAKAKRIAGNFVKKFDLMKEQGKGLYLFSSIKGSGKTRLAASILNALLKTQESLSIYYSPTADLIGEIKKTFSADSKATSSDIIDSVKKVDVLILDDIGVEKVTDWVEETFTRILDYRLQHKKITLFTSNLSIDELDEKYPQGRISSRIEKMTFPVHMPEEKIRHKLAMIENEKLLDTLLD